MDSKLTLSINKSVISRAKKYAKKENKSLSQLAEDYFVKLSTPSSDVHEISPLVKKLSGVIRKPLSDKHKDSYADYLSKKYS